MMLARQASAARQRRINPQLSSWPADLRKAGGQKWRGADSGSFPACGPLL